VAADYAAQQAALRGLEEPLPPRDLWARTAAALDRAEKQGRDLPNPSVFPGRRGTPGSRGARSIRGLRAEQRASAFRSTGKTVPAWLAVESRRRPARSSGLAWIAPFGALAAVAIVIVVGGSVLLSGVVLPPAASAAPSLAVLSADGSSAPIATPINVGAGEVAWLTPGDNGYNLNLADVDQVCPTSAKADCAPIAGTAPRKLPSVTSQLHTVIRDPAHRQLVVVPTSTKKGTGGSVMVVAVPTPVASPSPAASGSAAASGAGSSSAPTAASASSSVEASAAPSTSSVPSASASSPASGVVPPTSAVDSPVPSSTAASAGASQAPTAASATASASQPTATEVSPAAGSQNPTATGPQPTAAALAIISNVVIVGETASYSPDGTMLAFSARPADGSSGPDIYLWRPGDPQAHPVTTDHASVFAGWLNNELLGSRAVDAAGDPVTSAQPSDATSSSQPASSEAPTASGSGAVNLGPEGEPESPSPDASVEGATSPPSASDGSGTSADPSVAPSDSPAANAGAVAARFVADASGEVVAQSFILDPVTLDQTPLAAPAWRPVVDPTGRFVAYWAGSLRYDDATFSWVPDRGALVLASWPALRGTEPAANLSPVPLLGNSAASVPASEWDIRWDEAGTHLAIWAADGDNPELGRLTLLTIDPTGHVDPTGVSLHDAPALAGFAIGTDKLAWATPPGQDGEGSRLQVLAWSGENAGNIDSLPVSGGDPVVVVR
jgi:hypothetical protein